METQTPAPAQTPTGQEEKPANQNSKKFKGLATQLENLAAQQDQESREAQFLRYAAHGCLALAEGQEIPFAFPSLILKAAPMETATEAAE